MGPVPPASLAAGLGIAAAIYPWLAHQGPAWARYLGQVLLLAAFLAIAWTPASRVRADRRWAMPLFAVFVAAIPVLALWSVNDTDLGRCDHWGVLPDAVGDAFNAFAESWAYAGLVGAGFGMAVAVASQGQDRRLALWTAGITAFAIAAWYGAGLLAGCD